MLTYPGWVSALDHARMAPVLRELRHQVFRGEFPSEAAAVKAVVTVLHTGAEVLHRRRDDQADEILHATAETWRAELIAWAYRFLPSRRPLRTLDLDAFEAAVNDALHPCPWWQPFLRSEQPAPSSFEPHRAAPDKRLHLTLKEAAKALRRSEPTIRRMEKRGDLQSVTIATRKFIPATEIDRVRATRKSQSR